MYELTQVEKCKKVPPVWKEFKNIRLSKTVLKFLKLSGKSPRPARLSAQADS